MHQICDHVVSLAAAAGAAALGASGGGGGASTTSIMNVLCLIDEVLLKSSSHPSLAGIVASAFLPFIGIILQSAWFYHPPVEKQGMEDCGGAQQAGAVTAIR